MIARPHEHRSASRPPACRRRTGIGDVQDAARAADANAAAAGHPQCHRPGRDDHRDRLRRLHPRAAGRRRPGRHCPGVAAGHADAADVGWRHRRGDHGCGGPCPGRRPQRRRRPTGTTGAVHRWAAGGHLHARAVGLRAYRLRRHGRYRCGAQRRVGLLQHPVRRRHRDLVCQCAGGGGARCGQHAAAFADAAGHGARPPGAVPVAGVRLGAGSRPGGGWCGHQHAGGQRLVGRGVGGLSAAPPRRRALCIGRRGACV